MYADYTFYQNVYKGILIKKSDEYDYFAERASDELAQYAARVGQDTEEKQTAVKKAQCRIADILYGDFKSSKNGTAKMQSESVHGYYTTSYSAATSAEIRKLINEAIRTYLGIFLFRRVWVIY